MSKDHTYQVEKLINRAILELLRKSCINNVPDNQDMDLSKISMGDNDLIDIFLKLDVEIQQIIREQLRFVIESLKLSNNNISVKEQDRKTEHNEPFRKIGWLRQESELHNLHKILDQFAVIGATKDLFIQHFTGNEVPEKGIQWYEKNICLPYLFYFLKKNEIIPPHDNLFVLLSKHFCDSKGNYLNAGNLRKNYGQAYSYKMFSNFDYLMKALKVLLI